MISDDSETTFVCSATYFVDSICIGTCLKVQLSNTVQFFIAGLRPMLTQIAGQVMRLSP